MGKKHSKEAIERHRQASLRQFANGMPEETKRKLSVSHKGIYAYEKNPNWQGNNVGYHGIHSWLKSRYGKANKCEDKNCGGKCKKYEWALIKGKTYKRNRKHFMELCVSCHKKYDMTQKTRNKISRTLKGNIPWNKGIKKIK